LREADHIPDAFSPGHWSHAKSNRAVFSQGRTKKRNQSSLMREREICRDMHAIQIQQEGKLRQVMVSISLSALISISLAIQRHESDIGPGQIESSGIYLRSEVYESLSNRNAELPGNGLLADIFSELWLLFFLLPHRAHGFLFNLSIFSIGLSQMLHGSLSLSEGMAAFMPSAVPCFIHHDSRQVSLSGPCDGFLAP
jgi:hypothetical protein